ncbi:MAG TPA: FAD-dependent monooxygenase [Bryobacteraceae bacterium]|nr:FAD-dependent monooxygenase [Bryobacteraceae bacterium]
MSTLRHSEVYDIAIVGAGPAGAAAALSATQLRPHLRVALVEANRYDAWRAGETLSPGCQEILSGLGCWSSFRSAGFTESPGTRAVWGGPEPYDNPFLFSLRGNGWHVDRARFDALLCDAARNAGAEVIARARLCEVERAEPGFLLRLRHSTPSQSFTTIRARFVIDTSGRQASFASRCGARQLVDDRLIGVCGLLPATGRDAATLVESQADGWWYSSLLPGSRVIVAWMSDADLVRGQGLCHPERWMAHLHRTECTRGRISGDLLEPLRVWAAHSQHLNQVRGADWVAAGDAATTYDPASSVGILKALRAGKVASFVALDRLQGRDSADRYEKLVAGEYAAYRETKRRFYRQEQRWPGSPFWQRRVNGDQSKWQIKN